MKILFHSCEFGPGTGGIGQYLYQMAQGIKEFGHEVIVVTGKTEKEAGAKKYNFGTVYRLYTKEEIYSCKVVDEVMRLAYKHQVDIIEGTDHLGECASIMEKQDRPKIVVKYHGCQIIKALTHAEMMFPWQYITVHTALWKIRKQRHAEKRCVEGADCALFPSVKIEQDYLEQGIVLPSQRKLIPNMLSHLPTLVGNEESESPTILFVGRIEIRKGIQYFSKILRLVSKVYPDVVLEIAGGDQYARGLGSLKHWLQKETSGFVKRVRFLGALPPHEMDAAYRRCWLMVFPTKWDNFPMAVLEAMSYGKPVVTTSNGGMPEMLKGTESPIEDPTNDGFSQAILNLLDNKQLRVQIGSACRQRVLNNYMPEQIIPEYLKFIKACL